MRSGWLSHKSIIVAAILLTCISMIGGCQIAGLATYMILGDRKETVQIKAEYPGLIDQSVVILVTADDYTQFEYPNAIQSVATVLNTELAASVQGISIHDPKETEKYQSKHPHWHITPYQHVFQTLNVERLVRVELVQYSSHSPGDLHVRQGMLVANVRVIEVTDPDTVAYQSTVQAKYPPGKPLGTISMDRETIERGMTLAFSQHVIRLLTDHTIQRSK